MEPENREVRRWMIINVESYMDECDEINVTKLAEDACQQFDLYEKDDEATIPEWLFELSVKVEDDVKGRKQ